MRLHHVQLSCPPGGEDAARTFYVDGLGLTEVAKPATLAGRGGAWFRSADGAELHVGAEPGFRPSPKAHPALYVDDLDALAERLRAGGWDAHWDDLLPGHRRFYTQDPHGNRIELLTATRPDASQGTVSR